MQRKIHAAPLIILLLGVCSIAILGVLNSGQNTGSSSPSPDTDSGWGDGTDSGWGDGGFNSGSPNRPGNGGGVNGPPTLTPKDETERLSSFLHDCENNINEWQRGAAVYPRALTIEVNESATYDAGIDILGTGRLQDQFGSGPTYAEVPVDVRCGLGARLVSLDDSLEVDKTDWILQQFDTPGTVRWSWTVKAKKAGTGTLRLELRPAVAVTEGGYVVPAGDGKFSPTTAFTTQVQVEASPFQHAYVWWDENWPRIVAIGTALGAAIAGILAWVQKIKKQRTEAKGTRSTEQDTTARRGKSKSAARRKG